MGKTQGCLREGCTNAFRLEQHLVVFDSYTVCDKSSLPVCCSFSLPRVSRLQYVIRIERCEREQRASCPVPKLSETSRALLLPLFHAGPLPCFDGTCESDATDITIVIPFFVPCQKTLDIILEPAFELIWITCLLCTWLLVSCLTRNTFITSEKLYT